jgi:hypothetical protein
VPLNPNNAVEHETLPWCITCQDSCDENACPLTIQTRETRGDSPEFENMIFVNDDYFAHNAYDWNNEYDNVYNVQRKMFNVNENQMRQIKGQSIDANVITRMYGEMPSQEEIRTKIREKEWNTYRKKKQPISPQNHESQIA